jgi:hypothetical protein
VCLCVCVCVCVCIDEVDIYVEPAPLMLCSMSTGCEEVVFLATSICTFLLVVHDANSSFDGMLRHRIVAPVFHGSATLTRPMLQPYLNISQYISIHICM